jgi:hypothetical protein
MDNIYRSAYCTLSALGLYGQLWWSLHLQREIRRREQEAPWQCALDGPLITRAWGFQEQQLSPCIIHFTKGRILWECREYVAFEDYSAPIH